VPTHTKGGVTDEKKFYGVDTRWTDADADTANTMQNTDSAENRVEKVVNKSGSQAGIKAFTVVINFLS